MINAIEPSEIPFDAAHKSDGFIYSENFWRKLRGLVELNDSAIGSDPVWSVVRFNQPIAGRSFIVVASGGGLYKYDEQNRSFTQVHSGMNPNEQVEFLIYKENLYFGSTKDVWRRFDGGNKTYKVGGDQPPKKFKKIIFNPYAGRFFHCSGIWWGPL